MINGINHITISVRNIEESFMFFKDILGLKPVMKSPYSSYFLCGNVWLALVEEKNKEHGSSLYSHIALNVTEEHFSIVVRKLMENNVHKWQDNTTEGESFYFLDPSGNKFEIHYSTLANRLQKGKIDWKDVQFFI